MNRLTKRCSEPVRPGRAPYPPMTFSSRTTRLTAAFGAALALTSACGEPSTPQDAGHDASVSDAYVPPIDAEAPPLDAYVPPDDGGPRPWTDLTCAEAWDEGASGQPCEMGGACAFNERSDPRLVRWVECCHDRLSLVVSRNLCRAEGFGVPAAPWTDADCERALEEGESGDELAADATISGCARRTADPRCVRVATYDWARLDLREICAHGAVEPSGRDLLWRECPPADEGEAVVPWIGDPCEGEWQCSLPNTAARTGSPAGHVAVFCVDGRVWIAAADALGPPLGCPAVAP